MVLWKIFGIKINFFRSISPLTLEGHAENSPYSLLEPNESDIVNRQIGGKKLKYVLEFCTRYTSRDIAHAH